MNDLIERELTQGVVPIGTPKAYKYDAALVEAAKAAVQQGMTAIGTQTAASVEEVAEQGGTSKNEIKTLGNTILDQIKDGYGYPFTAATAADMTDTSKIYVYTGSEAGYTNGDWYYYDGNGFVSGGAFNSAALETDKTLSVSNKAADAAVTGFNNLPFSKADTSLWQSGYISTIGEDSSSSTRIRTKGYLGKNVIGIRSIGSGYVYGIFAYQQNDTFVGIWNGSTFVGSNQWRSEENVYFNALSPSYKYRLVVKNEEGTSISVSEASNVSLMFATDKSFTVEGAAADAKYLGDTLDVSVLTNKGNIGSNIDINTLKTPGMYAVSTAAIAETLSNWPFEDTPGSLLVFDGTNPIYSYGKIQIAIYTDSMKFRRFYDNGWGTWYELANVSAFDNAVIGRSYIVADTDVDTILTAGMYSVPNDARAETVSNLPYKIAGTLLVFQPATNITHSQVQMFITRRNEFYFRSRRNSTWSVWERLGNRFDELSKNPYANIVWSSVMDVTSFTHGHVNTQNVFNRAKAKYDHLAISNYHPAVPIYPLSDSFTDTDGVLASPNAEHTYFTGSDRHLHICGVGSFLTSDNDRDYEGTYVDAIKDIHKMLQYPNGGGATLNHPKWSDLSVSTIISVVDAGVFAIEVYNSTTEEATRWSDNLWDAVLSTGRQVFGVATPDWAISGDAQETRGWGYNHMLVRKATEQEILLAYRMGRFYGTVYNDDLKLSYFGISNGTATFTATKSGNIKFVTATRTVTVLGTATADFETQSGDVYVRAEIESDGNKLFTNAIMLDE